MSEENDTGCNSLCTTADAFENFQANAMFEEDEFITLSDIVPPRPEVPDLSNELNEVPYDNEVVLASDDNIAPSTGDNIETKDEFRQQNLDNCVNYDSKDVYSDKEHHRNIGRRNKNQKGRNICSTRGRKKTKSVHKQTNYQSDSSCLESENDLSMNNKTNQDHVHSTTMDYSTTLRNDVKGESKYPRRTRRERIPNTSKYPQLSEIAFETPSKRRGRPRKLTIENATISEPDSTNIDSSLLTSEDISSVENNMIETSNKTVGKKSKRGRPSNVSQVGIEQHSNPNESSTVSDCTETDIPLTKLKKPTRKSRKKVCEPSNKSSCNNEESQINDAHDNAMLLEMTAAESQQKEDILQVSNPKCQMAKDVPLQQGSLNKKSDHESEDMDIEDNISLSKIKENINNITENYSDNIEENMLRIHGENVENKVTANGDSKLPVVADFEETIHKVAIDTSIRNANQYESNTDNSLLVEDTSKRPNRRKAKKSFKYDVDSDEDPFANVELSDDEKPLHRKKSRYNDDDEYIPEDRKCKTPVSSSSGSEINEEEEGGRKPKRKKVISQSPKKRGRKTIQLVDEDLILEGEPETNIDDVPNEPLSMKPPAEAWANSNAFENFIAQKIQGSNLKIKKVSLKQKTENNVVPLDIPVLKQPEPKKFIEMCTQTSKKPTLSTGIQTSVPYDIPMKLDFTLTPEQSEKACSFLNSVVKTTAELGQLMKDKSEDFMKKKINTANVTGTFKMDYCVRKSFLLFKLARHNLLQMEDDLAKQYDEFLKSNDLSNCREEVKQIAPKLGNPKTDSDSDCEIVEVKEVPTTSVKHEKPKNSAKTVFLNKELSIKIAKKTSATDKNVKEKHTVWINDSVMVKKVKPTQSFLAQDSRNKKPPDFVTQKMVSDFFQNYYHQKAVEVCAPFVSTKWSGVCREYACHYFVKCNDFDQPGVNTSEVGQSMIEINTNSADGNCTDLVVVQITLNKNPKSLSSLCADVIRSCLHIHNDKQENEEVTCDFADGKNENGPMSLFRLCYQSLKYNHQSNILNEHLKFNNNVEKKIKSLNVLPLKTLCFRRISKLMPFCEDIRNISENSHDSNVLSDDDSLCKDLYEEDMSHSYDLDSMSKIKKDVKSLFSLCVHSIQSMYDFNEPNSICYDHLDDLDLRKEVGGIDFESETPRLLKSIVLENIKHFMNDEKETSCIVKEPITCSTQEDVLHSRSNLEDFTINCINTMSEEAFHSLDAANECQDEAFLSLDAANECQEEAFHSLDAANECQDEDDFDYEPDTEDYLKDNEGDENQWAAQVQMQVLRSCNTPINDLDNNDDGEHTGINTDCTTPAINSAEHESNNVNIENHDLYQNTPHSTLDNMPHIKLEPQDDIAENMVDSSIVKTEPVHALDIMTIIPENVVTKSELMEHNTGNDDNESIEDNTGVETDVLADTEAPVFDAKTFHQFVKRNKMMRSIDDDEDDDDSDNGGILTQSGLKRIRREHEPDYDAGIDINESLLIPQTFEPLHIDNAKGVLMESSSDESKDDTKKTYKKKNEKKKARAKKIKEVSQPTTGNPLVVTKEIPVVAKDVIIPIKDKAPTNEVAILTRKMREKIRQEEKKVESSDSENDNIALSLRKDKNKAKEPESSKSIKSLKQGESSSASNKEVDNEIQCNNVDSTEQTLEKKSKNKTIVDEFTGFSAIDQNEISSYQKFMKYVYDKIVPGDNSPEYDNASADGTSQECNIPTSPLISPDEPVELLECLPTIPIFDNETKQVPGKRPKKIKETMGKKNNTKLDKQLPKFVEKDGWHIYPLDSSDGKLYQNCHIPLEKLPESFVDTYLQYQDITDKNNIDKEVDRLANLHTLNRSISLKEGKSKTRLKSKSSSVSEQNSADASRAESPAYSDFMDELTPSEDEGPNADDEIPPPVPVRASENNVAKDSLMDDHESDSDGGTKKIKQEVIDSNEVEAQSTNRKPGPKSKTRMCEAKPNLENLPSSESLMLTADKMMNKELNLLHAPMVMKEEPRVIVPKEPSPKDETKLRKRSARNMMLRDRLKTEEDSSSEEEKQWVSTKEKLLKRVGKKEDAIADDAKRAKLVDDFIVRRGEGQETRRSGGPRGSRRSRKKFLEKLKQQRVLSKELLGEPSIDLTTGGKKGASVGLFKGRRNIRKVIDKKSLQKSTVLANMEEFERKTRLNAKQNRLRELLGCEEGVNVLVINDEVCLEYDFEEQRPIVTVHPFFTKVMKAHQYEGVKFMWDACFESLSCIESGRGGGGCILAHCMGLGKTLQVLALLHTVLTHPRAGMHRVLVCCPLSTVLNWVDEIHKWIGPVTDQIKVFELSKLKKTYERAYQLEDWYNGGGIFIIGYELFRSLTTLDPLIDEIRPTIINKIRTALLDPGPDIIICDEGHLLKNDCSVLAVAMSRVKTRRRIVLTGTPMQNNLREYYCMVNFVKPNLLGTYSEYSNRFENPIMNGQHRDSREEDIKLMKARTHILHKVLEGCLQRQEASVLYPYLPKKHEYTVFIPLTKCQWDLYKHYVHHYTKKSKQSILRDFHILQKIWSHPLVLHNFQTRYHAKKKEIKPEKVEDDLALEDKEDIKPPDTETWWLQYLASGAMLDSIDSSNKFVAVFRILHECIALGDKVLIFSTSLDCLDALESFLRQINGWNLGQEYYRLDGSVPAEVRQKWVREYNAENNHKTKLFLISTRAGCLGLNMTAANRVIILDTSWNPAHDIQSIFRVYRFGQKKDCYIYRLVAMGTMEQKIYERSVTKQAVACRVVDEQQIDRHYNMAELTELYKFDEHGVGVAGGVAVGVADVALLRVARDAAIHAVHEHDSLLRGSGEQGLPEHERAAAWMQFQQEHAHKQMQNDIETDLAARALKKLQDQQQIKEQLEHQRLEAQRQLLEKQQAQVLNIKTEDGPIHDLLVPREVQPPTRGKGGTGRGKRRGKKIVECRIPIKQDQVQPGSSQPEITEDMVQQVSGILIKYNFTQPGPHQTKELVAKVKQMTQTGKPLENCDELTASIARVLLQKQDVAPKPPTMPALTNVEVKPKRRGRSKKSDQMEVNKTPSVVPTPEPTPEPIPQTGGRLRRRAAIQAERQFDLNDEGASQDSLPDPVIEVDDDDWQAAPSDTDSAPDCVAESEDTKPVNSEVPDRQPKLRTVMPRTYKKQPDITQPQVQADDSSILLSDDEVPTPEPQPVVKPSSPVTAEKPVIALHPSLLTNQNFIKIVAHTYLAGNPMLDEDAATLAAQYSTFKLLKEFENTGKPIESGPIYDIAFKVLGEAVLKKLQLQPSDIKSSVESNPASSKMMQFLGHDATKMAVESAPVPAPAKRKPGPKSRVKDIKEEPQVVSKPVGATPPPQQKGLGLVPVDLLRRAPLPTPSPTPAPPAQAAGECILPDDEDDVRCITEQLAKPLPLVKLQIRNKKELNTNLKPSIAVQKEPTLRVTAGAAPSLASAKPAASKPAPAPANAYTTISLDSDDDEPIVAPAPRQQRVTRALATQYTAAGGGPVPVALTGPDSKPIPLAVSRPAPAPPPQTPPPPQPTFYPYPAAVRYPPEPVPLTGPDAGPVPVSLTGPDDRPIPISLTGPGFQVVPLSLGAAQHATPASSSASVSFVGPDSMSMSFAGMTQVPVSFANAVTSMPMKFNLPSSSVSGGVRPVSVQPALVSGPGGVRNVRIAMAPGQVQHTQQGNNVYLVPAQQAPAPPGVSTPFKPTVTKTYCKPGDILRLTATGQLEIIKSGTGEVHTIEDDEPQPVPAPKETTPKIKAKANKTPAPKVATPAPTPPPPPVPDPTHIPSSNTTTTTAQVTSKTTNEEQDRRKRKVSSSSSSSGSSRSPSPSPSPDPLSILKDVVHIQAPEITKFKTAGKSNTSKKLPAYQMQQTPSQTKLTSSKTKSTPKPAPAPVPATGNDTVIAKKLSDILTAVKSRKSGGTAANKSATNSRAAVGKIEDSIDLTETTYTSVKAGESSKNKKPGNPISSTGMKDGPTTVVGTSKNIVLDGKSKSLTNKNMIDLTNQKSVMVTKVRTIVPSSSNAKLAEKKRSAPSTEAPAKKKKTEPMTLKDFDIDDIDGIIELD